MALPAFVTDVSHTVWDSIKIGDYNPNTFSLPFQKPLSSAAHHHLSPQICQLTLSTVSARLETFRLRHQNGLVSKQLGELQTGLQVTQPPQLKAEENISPHFWFYSLPLQTPFTHTNELHFSIYLAGLEEKYDGFFLPAGERSQPCSRPQTPSESGKPADDIFLPWTAASVTSLRLQA